MEENPKPTRRRWMQYSLRAFFVFSLLVGCGCAWIGMQLEQKRRHESAVNEIVKLGGQIHLDNEKEVPGWVEEVPAWKEWLFGRYAGNHEVELDLSGTDATDALLYQIRGMNLTILWLGSTKVTDAGLILLEGTTDLHTLDLKDTRVTDAGLAHLKGLTGLQTLILNKTQITGAGLINLKSMTSLRILGLSQTRVSDAGLIHLKGMASLELLVLENTQVTQAGVDKLQQAIPRCSIDPLQ